jgi:hypothetical protein
MDIDIVHLLCNDVNIDIAYLSRNDVYIDIAYLSRNDVYIDIVYLLHNDVNIDIVYLSRNDVDIDIVYLLHNDVNIDIVYLSPNDMDIDIVYLSLREMTWFCFDKYLETNYLSMRSSRLESGCSRRNKKLCNCTYLNITHLFDISHPDVLWINQIKYKKIRHTHPNIYDFFNSTWFA